MARYIKVDGTEREVYPADGNRFSLKELQAFVGGRIEHIKLVAPESGHM